MRKLIVGAFLVWILYFNMGAGCEGCEPDLTRLIITFSIRSDSVITQRSMSAWELENDLDSLVLDTVYRVYNGKQQYSGRIDLNNESNVVISIVLYGVELLDTIEIEKEYTNFYSVYGEIPKSGCDGIEKWVEIDSLKLYTCYRQYQLGCE